MVPAASRDNFGAIRRARAAGPELDSLHLRGYDAQLMARPGMKWLRLIATVIVTIAFGGMQPAAAADRLPNLTTLLAIDDPSASRSAIDGEEQPVSVAAGQPASAVPEDEAPVYKRWWFWALTGAVVVGTVGLVAWASQTTESPARPCAAGTLVCFGDGR